jgi:dihydrofolate reductase
MNICLVTAMTAQRVIGKGNTLPWNIPEELHYFRAITLNKVVIMGGNTFLSLKQKPLPKRFNIILTKSPEKFIIFNEQSQHNNSLHVAFATNIQESLLIASNYYTNQQKIDLALNPNLSKDDNKDDNFEIMIIGGGEIYKQFLPLANKLYISIIKKDYLGDVFFPTLDQSSWKLIFSQEHREFISQIWQKM